MLRYNFCGVHGRHLFTIHLYAPQRSRQLLFASHRPAARHRGDYGFNVFHNSNPQHGGSYARHERRMRDDEVEDFLRSVKGWVPVHEDVVDGHTHEAYDVHTPNHKSANDHTNNKNNNSDGDDRHCDGNSVDNAAPSNVRDEGGNGSNNDNNGSVMTVVSSSGGTVAQSSNREDGDADATCRAIEPPPVSQLVLGEEAIKRTFTFPTFDDAYLFMGRLWAFCYACDKYPHVTWHQQCITVYLYSPSFRGLSRREARVAAFLNDQYNILKRCRRQQEQLLRYSTATADLTNARTQTHEQGKDSNSRHTQRDVHLCDGASVVATSDAATQETYATQLVQDKEKLCAGVTDMDVSISPGARVSREVVAALQAHDRERHTALDVVKAGLRHWDGPAALSDS